MLKIIETPFHTLEKYGVGTNYLLLVTGLLLGSATLIILDIQSTKTFTYIFITAPVWLPLSTFIIFFDAWLEYVQKKFDLVQGRTTLELKIPQEVLKSPEAMELVLIQLHQAANPDNHVQTYWDGKHPPRHSLELVSRGGDVRMYVNVPKKKFKNLAETHLYAQYPGIEVHELDIDYASEIQWDPNKFGYFSIHFGLKKHDAYPIKTYIEYGLQTMPKEEEKIDPISTMLEMLGSIGPGEYIWIQILISANRKTNFKVGSLGEHPDWTEGARKEIKEIIKNAAKRVNLNEAELKEKGGNINQLLTDAEKDTIKAIERSLGKNAFNTVIRGMYIGKTESFNPGERMGALISGWRSYDDLNRNSIGVQWRTDFDWNWWEDPYGTRKIMYKKKELNEYKRRAYTSRNSKDKSRVMTTEELATIFHIPGKVVTTPSFGRIQSKRAEPPSNLPIG